MEGKRELGAGEELRGKRGAEIRGEGGASERMGGQTSLLRLFRVLAARGTPKQHGDQGDWNWRCAIRNTA